MDSKGGTPDRFLSPVELRAIRAYIDAVLRQVPARLVQAALFGSRARAEAGPSSDVDILLVFSWLPPGRDPPAMVAEELATNMARESDIPLAAWSVALLDLECGNRTPMLVDALEDAIPLWWRRRPLPALPLTPCDAVSCVTALLARTEEGSVEFAAQLAREDRAAAARRVRDDLVRLCTAALLLRGITRPRRAAVVRAFIDLENRRATMPSPTLAALRWAARSFGPRGTDDIAPVPPPPGGLEVAAAVVEGLRRDVLLRARRFAHDFENRYLRDRSAELNHLRPDLEGTVRDPFSALVPS